MKHLTDGEIQSYLNCPTAEERVRIDLHLEGCPHCRKHLLLYRKLVDVVAVASADSIPEGFEAGVMGRLRRIRRLKRISDIVVTALASIGLVLVGSIVALSPELRHITGTYLADAWRFGCEMITATKGSSDAAVTGAFGLVLLVLFGAIDRLAERSLWTATGLTASSKSD